MYRCDVCHKEFSDKHNLFYHKKTHINKQSGSGDTSNRQNLQALPFTNENAPWINPDGSIDEEAKMVYEGESGNILAPSRLDTFPRLYNLPLDHSVSIDTIIDFVKEIQQNENNHFKINLDFGKLLDDLERDRVRYYIPLASHGILKRPFRMGGKQSDLDRLRRYLEKLDVIELAMKSRENSSHKFRYLTNLQVIVYPTNHLLGHGISPDFIKNSKFLKTLDKDASGREYMDQLCVFRCLAYHFNGTINLNKNVDIYFQQWCTFLGKKNLKQDKYTGLSMNDISKFEECFQVNISLYSMNEEGTVTPVYRSVRSFDTTLYLNQYDNHFSVITDFRLYGKTFECRSCGLLFNRMDNCERHEKTCQERTKYKYPGGYHKGILNIFEEAETLGIHIAQEDRRSPYVAIFDFESLMNEKNEQDSDNIKLRYIAEHKPISFSITSNVEGFTNPYSKVNNDPSELIRDMHDYLKSIAERAESIMREKWSCVFTQLEQLLEMWKPDDIGLDEDDDMEYETIEELHERLDNLDASGHVNSSNIHTISNDAKKKMYRKIQRFSNKFSEYARQLTVVGFNSSSYDCPLIMKEFVAFFGLHDTSANIVKQGKRYSNIKTEYFNFVDLLLYLPPHTSYSAFLKSFKIEERKLFFPYEWLNGFSKLDTPCLPPIESWHSKIKGRSVLDDGVNTIEENYSEMEAIWSQHNMTTMHDWLIHYNEGDVIGFLEGVKKMMDFYFDMNIDIFKSCISIPSVARRLLFETARKEKAHFSLFDNKNKDLFNLIKSNLTGGLSAVFHRHQKAGETFVDKKKQNVCKQVLGLDANS